MKEDLPPIKSYQDESLHSIKIPYSGKLKSDMYKHPCRSCKGLGYTINLANQPKKCKRCRGIGREIIYDL